MFSKKTNNRRKNPNRDVKLLVILFFVVLLLAIISSIISSLDFSDTDSSNNININTFENIEDVLTFYNCTYISEQNSTEAGYVLDIYTKLSKIPYENDETSNENFYNRLLNLSASVLNYQNFRFIDTENELTIEVQCENGSINKVFINGIEDYFAYMESQISLKKYKEIPVTEFSIDSEELSNLIAGSWNSNSINLGVADGNFQNYEQYMERGIKLRKINGKIYNIVYTKAYTNPVINGIIVREGLDVAKNKLGNPSFENSENNVYGYKGKNCYVFFSKDEISIYRREETDYTEFIELANKLSTGEVDLYGFMNELTYLWPDYSRYIVGTDNFYINYPTKGISIKSNYDNTNAIIIYNNCTMSTEQISKCLDLPECLSQMQVDNVFEDEIDRISERDSLLYNCEKFLEENKTENNPLINSLYGFYAIRDENNNIKQVYFISKDGNRANREMIEYIDTFAWLSNSIFLYSIPQRGIYYFNLDTNKKGSILTGNEEFKIQSCNNNLLKYDDKEIQISF